MLVCGETVLLYPFKLANMSCKNTQLENDNLTMASHDGKLKLTGATEVMCLAVMTVCLSS